VNVVTAIANSQLARSRAAPAPQKNTFDFASWSVDLSHYYLQSGFCVFILTTQGANFPVGSVRIKAHELSAPLMFAMKASPPFILF